MKSSKKDFRFLFLINNKMSQKQKVLQLLENQWKKWVWN